MTSRIASAISRILQRLDSDNSENKAILSNLRGCTSVSDRKAAIVWPLLFENMKASDLSKNGQPTYAEKSIFSTLRLYAIYRQGNDSQTSFRSSLAADDPGLSFFAALARLKQNDQICEALNRRVQAVLASNNYEAAVNGLYHLMQILHSNLPHLKIDFAQLGGNLYFYQFSFENARSVCLRWGEQYFSSVSVK